MSDNKWEGETIAAGVVETVFIRLRFLYEDGTTRTYDLNFIGEPSEEDITAAKLTTKALREAADEDFKAFFVSDEGATFVTIDNAELHYITEEVIW